LKVNPSGTIAKFDIITAKQDLALRFHRHLGPVFGDEHDIAIATCCHQNSSSNSNLGRSYSGAGAQPQLFVGQKNFQVAEYEVFGLA